jgi:hypothetical protein
MNNDTPRTNDIIDQIKGFRTSSAIYSLEQFSRTLETELTTAREYIEMLNIRYRAAAMHYDNNMADVMDQRDRLAEALRKIKNAGGTYNDPYDELDFIDGVTFEALQSLTTMTDNQHETTTL